MRVRSALALGIVLLFGATAFAQEYPKVEVGLNYSYVRFNPENSNWTNGGFSLNGGGGDVTYFFTKHFGLKGDFMGTTSQTRTVTVPSNICNGGSCAVSFQANLFTYNALAVYKARMARFEPFVEGGFGGAHSNAYANFIVACSINCVTPVKKPSNNAFDFIIGGGFDIPITKHFAIRPAQFDFLLTRFGNGFTGGNQNQSNFRYQAGVNFRFGGGAPPPPPRPPVASCSANPTTVLVGSGDIVSVRADASSPDNAPLSYAWTATGGSVDGTGSQARWNSAGLSVGTYSVSARVDDGRGGTTSCSAEVRVAAQPNRPPTMACNASPTTVRVGDRAHIAATASDPDNDPLTYSWQTSGGNLVGSGDHVDLDTTGLAPSSYTVSGHVDDGRGGTADCRAAVNVEAAPPPAVEAKLVIRSVYFPTAVPTPGKPDVGLLASQQETLTSLASDFKEYLASKPDAHLVLEGHADQRGAPAYNQALSERRVAIAKNFLVGQGIPEGNLETKAYGEEHNLTPEDVKQLLETNPDVTQEQRDKLLGRLKVITLAQNRRVDITLSSTGQQSVRHFPFNAADALTLLSPNEGGTKPAAKNKP